MIDISGLTYRIVLLQSDGSSLDITNASQDVAWEENKGELAMRITLTLKNEKFNGRYLSSLAKLNSVIGIFASYGGKNEEVARGRIITWETTASGSKDNLKVVCYDELYDLQKSQDNLYFSAGTGTRAALTRVFENWGISLAKYDGPNETHAKLVYKRESLSEVILDILDDAVKKGSDRYIVQASKGAISILPRGNNSTVYHFGEDGSTTVQDKWSTADMVTRVKVIGQEDDDGNSPVEALVDGKTQYGVRQKIYIRGKDDSLEDAKSSAQEILDEKGDIEKTITVQAPDIPYIRKGDLVHITAGTLDGYHYVRGIRHNADDKTMSMDLLNAKESDEAAASGSTSASSSFEKGDRVILNGAVYVDSYGNGKGNTYSNRICTITLKVDTSRPCPYHVDGIGWVYPNTITKA